MCEAWRACTGMGDAGYVRQLGDDLLVIYSPQGMTCTMT